MTSDFNRLNNPYINSQFQGGPVQDKVQETAKTAATESHIAEMFHTMDLPGTPDEFVKFIPCWGGALGMGLAIKAIVNHVSKAKGLSAEQVLYSEAFQKSKLYKWGTKIDNVINPIVQRNKKIADGLGKFRKQISRFTPNIIKDAAAKYKIGGRFNSNGLGQMGESMANGVFGQAVDDVIDNLEKADDATLKKLHVKDIMKKHKNGALTKEQAFDEIIETFNKKGIKLSDVKIKVPRSFKMFRGHKGVSVGAAREISLEAYLTRAQLLKGAKGATKVTKGFHKLFLGSAEGIAGFIGGPLGFAINSLFLGSAFWRAKNAEEGEKTSTFMESIIGDMIGGYLIMFPITKAFKHGMGLKYIGMEEKDIKEYKRLLDETYKERKYHAKVDKYIKKIKKNKNFKVDDAVLKDVSERFKLSDDLSHIKTQDELAKFLNDKRTPVSTVNGKIDKLKKLKKTRTKVKFFKNPLEWLTRKPVRLLGRIIGLGKEQAPVKLGLKTHQKVWAKMGRYGKMAGGIGVAFGTVMMVTDFFRKPLIKLSHKIFGRPTKSLLDEEEADKAKETENKNNEVANNKSSYKDQMMTDFLNQTRKSHTIIPPHQNVQQPVYNNLQQQTPTAPAAKAINEERYKEGSEPKRTYIPSSEPAFKVNRLNEFKSDDRVSQALSKSDYYAQQAEELLKEL